MRNDVLIPPQTASQFGQGFRKRQPGSWVVFVNGQRHHETFLTRAAARREAKRQKETNKIDSES
jgi:hypothetical protein